MVIDDVEYRRDEKLIYTMKRETVITREIMHVKRTLFFFFFFLRMKIKSKNDDKSRCQKRRDHLFIDLFHRVFDYYTYATSLKIQSIRRHK